MKKYIKYIILAICIILGSLVGVIILNKDNTEIVNSQTENTSENLENVEIENNEIENKIENTVIVENTVETENVVSEEKTETVLNIIETPTVYEQETDVGSTNRKQEAINLVKEKWGQDDTVTFRCDSVTNNGEYIIAVLSKDSAKVKNYFRVNLDKKEVIVDY